MVATFVPVLSNSQPCCLSSQHLFEADIEVGVILVAVYNKKVNNSASLIEVAQLPIVVPSRVLVVDRIAWLR